MAEEKRVQNNYEIQVEYAKGIFLKYDQEKIIEQFQLAHNEEFLFVNFIHSPYRISRATGSVERMENGNWMGTDFHEVMSIYDMICNEKGRPILTKQWSPIGNLGGMQNASAPVGANSFDKYGELFAGKQEALSYACEQLGGTKAPRGDVAYYLPLFDFLPVYLRFYDADEEFPAQIQILWDTNTCRYFRYETTFYATIVLMEKIKKIAQNL